MAPRVPKCSIARPLLIGNTARPLGDRKPPTSDHTHEWTVQVKGVKDDDDISYFVKKVVFKLHDTYPNPTRTIEQPPYQVTETGWGEFDVQVKIFFAAESGEKPVALFHRLKLHPYGPEAEAVRAGDGVVSSWQYDEVVFNEPTEAMYEILTTNGSAVTPLERSAGNVFSQRTEQEEIDRLDVAISKVDAETKRYKAKILAMEGKA